MTVAIDYAIVQIVSHVLNFSHLTWDDKNHDHAGQSTLLCLLYKSCESNVDFQHRKTEHCFSSSIHTRVT